MKQKNREKMPIYERIAEDIRNDIVARYRPDQRYHSQNVLARQFNASPTTVREAVNSLVQEGLLVRRHGSGTFVTDPNKNRTIAVLIGLDISYLKTPFYWLRLPMQLLQFFDSHGHSSHLYMGKTKMDEPAPEKPVCKEFWRDIELRRINAIASLAITPTPQFISAIKAAGIPHMDPFMLGNNIMSGHQDEIIFEGIQYLLARGRKKIAVISKGTRKSPGEAFTIAQKAMKTFDHSPDSIKTIFSDDLSHLSLLEKEFLKLWSSADKPDSVFVTDDSSYPPIARAIYNAGIKIPEQLILLSHYVKHASYDAPNMPVVKLEVDPDEHAAYLGRALLNLMNENKVEQNLSWRGYQLILP